MKNFILKYKTTIGVCVLTATLGIGWWVLGNPGTTTIGENVSVSGNLTVGGNAGIGTANPGAKLEVSGNVIASVPTADTHVATKGYVDALAGGANALPTYVIRNTAAASKGNLGGRAGANDKCQAEFGSGAIMFGTQHINCYTKGTCILEYRISANSWYDLTGNVDQNTAMNYTQPSGWAGDGTCLGWTRDSWTGDGAFVNWEGIYSLDSDCTSTNRVACAVPKQ